VWLRMIPSLKWSVKFGSIDSHSPMRVIWVTLRLAREIWRINQSCEVLTKAKGNIQPLRVKPKVRMNEMLYDPLSQDVSLMQKSRGTHNLCEHRQSSEKSQEERTTSVSLVKPCEP
jgi:hypothetical protein